MKKRLITVLFIISAALLATAYLYRKYIPKEEEKTMNSRVVIPQVDDTKDIQQEDVSIMNEEFSANSLIPLLPSESLINIVSMDFDNDGYEDQINEIKTSTSPYISLLVGFFNAETESYERSAVIETKIIQAKTFVYTGKDLIGEHKICLVYQGFDESGDSILQAYLFNRNGNSVTPVLIADFVADGTIFISQVDRPQEYERSTQPGSSWPIWVYKSDVNANTGAVDQLQIMYDWNAETRQYEEKKKSRVSGSSVASKELARIQDGTEKTFGNFLNGLWYKVENDTDTIRYLFVDYDAKEIIFLYDDTEEVYNWNASKLRKNGIYISSVNMITENLTRNINISLLSIDSINMRIQDDVRMEIREAMWDGEYRKKNMNSIQKASSSRSSQSDIFAELEKGPSWQTADGSTAVFNKGIFSIEGGLNSENGRYVCENLDDGSYIQLLGYSENSKYTGTYSLSFSTYEEEVVSGTGKKKTTSIVTKENPDSIVLKPVILSPEGNYVKEEKPFILTRN